MRITNASGVRNDLLQEIANQTATPGSGNNALSDSRNYIATLAPHPLTQRATYTAPVNKQAFIEGIYGFTQKATTGVATGVHQIIFYITPFGGAKQELWRVSAFQNVAYDGQQLSVGSQLRLFAGDEFSVDTQDMAGGGTASYILGFKITEFDD